MMDDAIKNALRLARSPLSYRHAYATDGYVEGVPEEESQEDFIKKELEGSAPQYDPEAGILTGKRAGLMAAGFAPGSGLATAAGKFPTAEGGFEPSVKEDIKAGNYGSAALKTLGAAGDVAYAVPFVGPAAGAALKAPLALKFAASIAPAAKVAGEAATAAREAAPVVEAAREAAPVVEAAVETAPQLTKKQALAEVVQRWAEGGGQRDKYNSPHHEFNVEIAPRYASAAPAAPQPVLQKAQTGFMEPDEYRRVKNPAGFYSHGAEVARQLSQQKGTPQQMIQALKSAGVKPEEIRWSGVEKAFADRPHVTGEELATHFEENLPKASRIERYEGQEPDEWDQSRLWEEEYNRIHEENYDSDFAYEMSNHDTEGMSERELERLEERINDRLSEQYSEQASEAAWERQRELEQELAPKFANPDYNLPGGYDYREHIYTFPYTKTDKIHPEVMDFATKQEYEGLKRAHREAQENAESLSAQQRERLRKFHQQNAENYAAKEAAEMEAAGHKFITPEEAEALRQKYFDKQDEYSAARGKYVGAWRNNDPNADLLDEEANLLHAEVRDLYDQFTNARAQTKEAYTDDLMSRLFRGTSEADLAQSMGNEAELNALKKPEEINAAQEVQQKAKDEFYNFEQQLMDASEKYWKNIPAYQRQLFQARSHWGDTENPFWHGRYRTYDHVDPKTGEKLRVLNQDESQSDMAKEAFLRKLTPQEDREFSQLLGRQNKTPEENLRLAQLVGKAQEGIHEAPYVGKTEKWSELAAKDALMHALENDMDRIFVTGGEEQAKRWSNAMRKAANNVEWRTTGSEVSVIPQNITEQYVRALYGKNLKGTTDDEYNKAIDLIHKIHRGQHPDIFPNEIYKMPREERKVVLRMTDGSTRVVGVSNVKMPDGKIKPIITSSNFGAQGKNLSELVGSKIADQISQNESGSRNLHGALLGSSGYSDVYDSALPKAYAKVMKSLDPEAKIEHGVLPTPRDADEAVTHHEVQSAYDSMTPDQKEQFGPEMEQIITEMELHPERHAFANALRRHASSDLQNHLSYLNQAQREGTWVHITPKMKEEYRRLKRKFGAVFPAYKRGGAVYDKLNAITKRGLPIAERLTRADGGNAFKINRKTQEPVHGLKITPPAEELSDDPEIRRYQMARHAHEFIGSEEPEAPRRPVVLDAPLLGGKKELFSVPYQYHPAIEKALKLAYGQKTLPLYATPETTPIGRALDAYEAAKFIQQDPSNPANYTGVPGTLWKIAGSEVPAVAAGAILAKDEGKTRQNGRDRTIFEKLFDFDVAPSVISHPKSEELPMRLPYGQRYNEKTGELDSPESKGIGFRGPLSQGDHIVSEYSADRDISYPSIYEGIDKNDLANVMMAERLEAPPSKDVDQRAYEAAKRRTSEGKSPFFELGKDKYPEWSPDQDWPERKGYAEGGSAPYGVTFMGDDKVIIGSPHGQKVELSDDLKQKIQDIANKHGAYYEGAGGDIEPNKDFLPKYNGSWDDLHAKTVKGYPVEYLSPMFSNVDVNKPHEAFLSPDQTIMSSLISNQDKMKYFKDRRYDEKVLRDFLQAGSENDVDLLKMSQLPATKENLQKFFKTGESLTWPENWLEYPNKLGKLAKKTEDSRNQFLLNAPSGVYVAGAGHLLELKRLREDLNIIGGERSGD